MTFLLTAAMLDLLPAMKDLQTTGVEANICNGIEELYFPDVATLMSHPEVVRALLKRGVDVNDASPSDYTVWQHVVNNDRVDLLADVIDLPFSAGADIDARTGEDFTTLHLASCRPDCGDETAHPPALRSSQRPEMV